MVSGFSGLSAAVANNYIVMLLPLALCPQAQSTNFKSKAIDLVALLIQLHLEKKVAQRGMTEQQDKGQSTLLGIMDVFFL